MKITRNYHNFNWTLQTSHAQQTTPTVTEKPVRPNPFFTGDDQSYGRIITYNLLSIECTTIFDIGSETKKQNNLTKKRVTMKNYSLFSDYL